MSLIKIFSRQTNTNNFIPEIDGLRFIAILTVLIFHLNTSFSKYLGLSNYATDELGGTSTIFALGWWIIRMDLGVKLFFSISGFILALPFLKAIIENKKVNLYDYFKRRLLRLEPPFIISLILFFLVHILILNGDVRKLLFDFLAGLIYLHGTLYGYPNPINPVTWSLEVEAQFYIIIPFLFIFLSIFKKGEIRFFIVLLLFLLGLYLKTFLMGNLNVHLSTSILLFSSNFFIGIIFAFIFLNRLNLFFWKENIIWDFVGILSIFIMFYFYKPQSYWVNNLIFNLAIIFLFISSFNSKFFRLAVTNKFIYLVGGMCYSIYLLHYPLFYFFAKFKLYLNWFDDYKWNLIASSIFIIPLVILISSVFFVLIEKPCMDKNWPNKLSLFLKNFSKKQ